MLLGIDTSNYTTSAATFDERSNSAINYKKPLPVKSGERGLRQSDAVFHHTVNLPDVLSEALKQSNGISAVGVSVRPRDAQGSYMPCFRAGYLAASAICNALKIPLYEFSHQAGHIAAALYSAGRLDLLEQQFIAFHFSGGTSEAVLVEPDKERVFSCEIVARSSDLKAGQVIDRCGVLLGLDFPCGPQLEKLASQSDKTFSIKLSVKGSEISLSGVENKFVLMKRNGYSDPDIAKFTIDSVMKSVIDMTEYLVGEYDRLPLLYAGGVMSNSQIRKVVSERFDGIFATPEFSSDNALGIAVLAAYKGGYLV